MPNDDLSRDAMRRSWHSLLLLKTVLKRNGCRITDESRGDEIWYSPLIQHSFSIACRSMTRAGVNAKLAEAGVSKRF
jgi:hypothetical protein